MNRGRFAVIIPVYNHEQRVADVIRGALKLGFPVIAVDDGSTDATTERIQGMAGVSVIRHETNRGKGAALKSGFAAAAAVADWAITIDADGQHDPDNARTLIAAIPEGALAAERRPIIIGRRENMVGDDVPWTSRFGRKFSNFWVRASGGPAVTDSQSGFRIYPLPQSGNMRVRANRFQFEVEILARAGWMGYPVIEAPISVSYTPGTPRISHFRPFVDFWRNSGTFMRLIFQRLLVPRFIRRRMSYKA
ncbi:MAG: glycosyltransferase family 2 protein [Spirochaetes bacterium]|nr:glycosyltransferase family 2 protein [Spirochaetota bacterium]HOD13077.1 glycosyltransferase family 2 protein [Spirochaetota bacterium]